MTNILIGIIGKPSSGKTTFLNAMCNTNHEVHSRPFTTLEPQYGVTYHRVDCLCKKIDIECNSKHDRCVNGIRFIPIDILDVPGLIPDASKGIGLGNKFLDAIRKANILLHIVDASGLTNSKGEAVEENYDCSKDIEWINDEIIEWIFNNLNNKWNRILSLYKNKKLDHTEVFIKYLSGYGCNKKFVRDFLSKVKIQSKDFFLRNYFQCNLTDEERNNIVIKEQYDITDWKETHIRDFVKQFVRIRFPTVIGCNKIDLKRSARNITNVFEQYSSLPQVPVSALTEVFLKKLNKKGLIKYVPGDTSFEIIKKDDKKLIKKLDKVNDLIFKRFNSTGCFECIKSCLEIINPVTMYSIMMKNGKRKLQDVIIVRNGITVYNGIKVVIRNLNIDINKIRLFVEDLKGLKISLDMKLNDNVCDIGKIPDCYNSKIVSIPSNRTNCSYFERLHFHAETIKLEDTIIDQTFAVLVRNVYAYKKEDKKYCLSEKGVKENNVSLYIKLSEYPDEKDYDFRIKQVYMIHGNYKKMGEKILDILRRKAWAVKFRVNKDEIPAKFKLLMVFNHPMNKTVEKPKCYLDVLVYSCWQRFYVELIIVISSIVFGMLLLCSLCSCFCCCCVYCCRYCKRKRRGYYDYHKI